MYHIEIPEEDQVAFLTLVEAKQPTFDKIVESLKNLEREINPLFIEERLKKTSYELDQAERIASFITKLFFSYIDRSHDAKLVVVEGLYQLYYRLKKENKVEKELFFDRFNTLLDLSEPWFIAYRIALLKREQGNRITETLLSLSVKPVYDNNDTLIGSIPLCHLKLGYIEREKKRDIVFNLDKAAIVELTELLERAVQQIGELESQLSLSNLHIIDN